MKGKFLTGLLMACLIFPQICKAEPRVAVVDLQRVFRETHQRLVPPWQMDAQKSRMLTAEIHALSKGAKDPKTKMERKAIEGQLKQKVKEAQDLERKKERVAVDGTSSGWNVQNEILAVVQALAKGKYELVIDTSGRGPGGDLIFYSDGLPDITAEVIAELNSRMIPKECKKAP